ncbi:DUF58 domain-containing protein [Pseudoalteromonas pernae]|uniref:DUF58 domain-containing protein n=1 Tax=Pseudoalteromonas pernae TaxID=3118054 RepID=UPI0032420329
MFAFVSKAFSPIGNKIESLLLRDKHKTSRITLSHNTLYVLPSKMGMLFLLVAVLNFILGANYQNNLIQVTAYLMLILVLMSLIQAYSNMKGLVLDFQDIPDVFANQPVSYRVRVSNEQRRSYAVYLKWDGVSYLLDSVDNAPQEVIISGDKHTRGKYAAKRLKIMSSFPFSLAQVWSYLEPKKMYYVYPATYAHNHPLSTYMTQSDESDSTALYKPGNDEFAGLREQKHQVDYRRISWKHFAKREELLEKEFVTQAQAAKVLDFESLVGSTEQRLSMMAFTIEEAKRQSIPIAIQLPGRHLATDGPTTEYTEILRALATFKQGRVEHG